MTNLQKTLALLAAALGLLLIWLLQPILTPFLAGAALAYLGDPLVDRLEAWKVNRSLGVLIVFLVFFAAFASMLLVVVPLLVNELASLVRQLPALIKWLHESIGPFLHDAVGMNPFDIETLDISTAEIAQRIRDNWQEAGGVLGSILAYITRSGLAFIAALGTLALTPVVAFYIMRDWDHIMDLIRVMVPRDHESTFVTLAVECDEVLSAFLRGQLMIMLLLGIIYSTGLYIVGLELAILIGMMAGLLSIVPYLGFIIGIAAAILAAIFQFQEILPVVFVVLVFVVGQLLEGSVLTPWLVGNKIGMHPVAVIFAVLAGGQLFGFVGILLALPVAAVIMVFLRHLHGKYIASDYYRQASDAGVRPSGPETHATSNDKAPASTNPDQGQTDP